MTPPPHTALHGWNKIERHRNGDLVVPLVTGGGDVVPLRGTALMWEQFDQAIRAALKAEKAARKTKAGAPKLKPNGRLL